MRGVGVVGTGWVSTEHIKALEATGKAEIVALTSRTEEGARRKAEELGLKCELFTDYEKMLAHPEVEIVCIDTPNHLHAAEGILAAQAGKPFAIEKPVAITHEELHQLRDAVRASGVKTVVGFVLRWNPYVEITRRLIADGSLGKIYLAECDYRHRVGGWYSGYHWVTQAHSGKSSLLAAGCHSVDALRWLVGEVSEVSAYAVTPPGSDYEYPPVIVAVLRFESGAIGKVSSNFECRMPYQLNVELYGDGGTLRNNRLWSDKFAGQTDYITIPTIMPDSGDVRHHPFAGEMAHFLSCIESGVESHCNVEDAVKTHEVCIACDRSAARGGEPVKLPLDDAAAA